MRIARVVDRFSPAIILNLIALFHKEKVGITIVTTVVVIRLYRRE